MTNSLPCEQAPLVYIKYIFPPFLFPDNFDPNITEFPMTFLAISPNAELCFTRVLNILTSVMESSIMAPLSAAGVGGIAPQLIKA